MGVVTRNMKRIGGGAVAGKSASTVVQNNAYTPESTTYAKDSENYNQLGIDADEDTDIDIGGEDRKRRGQSDRGRVSRTDSGGQSSDTAQARANSGTGLMI